MVENLSTSPSFAGSGYGPGQHRQNEVRGNHRKCGPHRRCGQLGRPSPGHGNNLGQRNHHADTREQTDHLLRNDHCGRGAPDGLGTVLPLQPLGEDHGKTIIFHPWIDPDFKPSFFPDFRVFRNGFFSGAAPFCGAGLRQPTDHLIRTFQEETGHSVKVTYAGSGQLLSSILASGQGDLFMPGAFFYIRKLKEMGRIDSSKNLVAHTAVVGVNIRKGNLIRSFDDLARPGLRLALGDPKAMAFGRMARAILSRSPLKDAILKNVVVYGATVKQLALYVARGDVDASIIGRADAFQFRDKIRMVPIPPAYFQPETIAIAVLKDSKNQKAASRFCDFMASKQGIAVFEDFGFLPLSSGEAPKGKP